jgi:TonB family protein
MLGRTFLLSLLLHAGLGVYAAFRCVEPPVRSEARGDDESQMQIMFRITEAPAPQPANEEPLPPPSEDAPVPEPEHVLTQPEPEPQRQPEPEKAPVAEPEPQPAPTAEVRAPEPSRVPAPSSAVITVLPGHNAPPDYPAAARRRGCCGTVLLRVDVDRAGLVTEVVVQQSCGHAVLDDAALRAVRHWRFQGGPGRVVVPVEFVLRK